MAAALGSCMATMAGMVANRLGLTLFGLGIEIEKVLGQTPPYRLKFRIKVSCSDQIESSVIEQIEGAMRNCPVHQSLGEGVIQEMQFNWAEATAT
jgi:putative redox protein